MYIQNKVASAFYKLSLGLISLYGFWMTLALFGSNAWRLFSTWALFIGAIYFCVSALILALSSKRQAGDAPCAMLEGMLIVAFVVQFVAVVSCSVNDEYLPGLSGFVAVVSYYILPILALLDWCLFNKKGQWRAIEPFYWLALPLAYCAMIILTANMLPSSSVLLYPVAFLDYNSHGFWEMLGWLALIGLLILIFGYILVLLDAFLGGTIAKHIVLPHIRTVTIDDEEPESKADADSGEPNAADFDELEDPETANAEPVATAKPNISRPKDKTKTAPQAPQPRPSGKRKINDITRPKSNNANNPTVSNPAEPTKKPNTTKPNTSKPSNNKPTDKSASA